MNSEINIEHIIREFLPGVFHMSLATCSQNKPWVCEVHFAYDDHLNLYFRSLKSRRHSLEISANPCVAGNIVKQFALEESPVGVYFEGTAQMLENDSDEMTIACASFEHVLGKSSKDIRVDAQNPDGHKVYKITVDTYFVFGKFGQPKGQKHTLVWNGGGE